MSYRLRWCLALVGAVVTLGFAASAVAVSAAYETGGYRGRIAADPDGAGRGKIGFTIATGSLTRLSMTTTALCIGGGASGVEGTQRISFAVRSGWKTPVARNGAFSYKGTIATATAGKLLVRLTGTVRGSTANGTVYVGQSGGGASCSFSGPLRFRSTLVGGAAA